MIQLLRVAIDGALLIAFFSAATVAGPVSAWCLGWAIGSLMVGTIAAWWVWVGAFVACLIMGAA